MGWFSGLLLTINPLLNPLAMARYYCSVLLLFFLASCDGDDNTVTTGPDEETTENPEEVSALLQIQNGEITDPNGDPLYLQGICFNNWHWIESPLPPDDHHAAVDYQRVANMGMNAVRFNLN